MNREVLETIFIERTRPVITDRTRRSGQLLSLSVFRPRTVARVRPVAPKCQRPIAAPKQPSHEQ
jgi:hypothetical protein